MVPAILFVVGASGAGKTAAVHALDERALPEVRCYHFDTIGVPTVQVMEQEWGGGERWQEQMTRRWIERLAANTERAQVAVLEGQTRPSFIEVGLAGTSVRHFRIVLLDSPPSVRNARLQGPRAQPELSNETMNAWAAYLRGQADALGLPVVDTSRLSINEVAAALEEQVDALRATTGAAA